MKEKQMDKENTRRGKASAGAGMTVDAADELLPFLLRALPGKGRNSVKALLTNGAVTVDGQTETRHDHPLRAGQTVRVARAAGGEGALGAQVHIIYEDSELIAIDKPAGLLSVATDAERGRTACRMVSDYVGRAERGARIYVVHRLDRDTSGVLLFAKNERLKLALQEDWNERALRREYAAVVEGRLAEKSGTLRSRLRQNAAMRVYSDASGKTGQEAVTDYRVAAEGAKYSLLSIRLETGRKNQIRVQMEEIGHPVAGDRKYGAATDPLKRLALHANALEIIHPFTGARLCFETDIPASFRKLIK